ncbi:MAG: transglycosylase SLT domain-containing protein [Bacteroidota bacterium]
MKPEATFMLSFVCVFLFFVSCQSESSDGGVMLADSLVLESHFVERPIDSYNYWDTLLQESGRQHQIDWMLIKAVMLKESHGEPDYVSYVGAVGLMQLMPREGSYFADSYRAYQQARKLRGKRVYNGKTQIEWGKVYQAELQALAQRFADQPDSLYRYDRRFHAAYNILEGGRQLAGDFQFFRSRGHGPYTSQVLAIAAYNAGRYAVMQDKSNPKLDHIPINRQTELYVGGVQKIYLALVENGGALPEGEEWRTY